MFVYFCGYLKRICPAWAYIISMIVGSTASIVWNQAIKNYCGIDYCLPISWFVPYGFLQAVTVISKLALIFYGEIMFISALAYYVTRVVRVLLAFGAIDNHIGNC